MAAKDQTTLRTCIFVLTFSLHLVTASGKCADNDIYIIWSKSGNNIAIDAVEPDNMKVQHPTGTKSQLWKFQSTGRPGSYFIVSEENGKVLDFVQRDGGLHLVAKDKDEDSLQQHWNFNHNRRIVNFENSKIIEIEKSKYDAPGARLILSDDNGCGCQEFFLEKKV